MKTRIAAEWEPALGVMVAWPPAIPRALVQEFAKDTTLYCMVADSHVQSQAEATLAEWGVSLDKVKFLVVEQGEDCSWPRDWGPQPLFKADGSYCVLGPRYVYSTPFCSPGCEPSELYCAGEEPVPLAQYECDGMEDEAAGVIAEQLGVEFVKLPFAFTGGNVLSDGVNSIISTEVLVFENMFDGTGRESFLHQVASVTNMTNYTITSNYEDFSLNHIDCLAKPIDDRRLLVLRFPEDHPHYQRVEDVVNNELATALNSYGQPWEIVRLDTGYIHREGMVAAYINSLILNKNVYVPCYSIPEDALALEQWRDAMPGYNVKGFEFVLADEPESDNTRGIYEQIGWDAGDVLHCRTRAVWDPEMLYVRASRPCCEIAANEPFDVVATVVAYSGRALRVDQLVLCYRVSGSSEWTRVALRPRKTLETYAACIPGMPSGTTVEYYVQAADESGRLEAAPRTAPAGFYSYVVK